MQYCLIVLLVVSFNSWGKDCFPKNNLSFPIQDSFTKNKDFNSGLTYDEYQTAINLFKRVWGKILKDKYQKDLLVNELWHEDTVDAKTTRDDLNNPVIFAYGGLARHPEMNFDGYLLILCHELGHHLGGAPKSYRGRSQKHSWSSAEGQADYFAANKCFPKFLGELSFRQPNTLKDLDQYCSNDNCKNVIPAAMSVGKVFASIKSAWRIPSLNNPSMQKVSRTYFKHPNPQCRFDTFLAGSLCSQEFDSEFDDNDHRIGSCLFEQEPKLARPKCWFANTNY